MRSRSSRRTRCSQHPLALLLRCRRRSPHSHRTTTTITTMPTLFSPLPNLHSQLFRTRFPVLWERQHLPSSRLGQDSEALLLLVLELLPSQARLLFLLQLLLLLWAVAQCLVGLVRHLGLIVPAALSIRSPQARRLSR